jgi:ADP-heptose:LPS heptosyltransferase
LLNGRRDGAPQPRLLIFRALGLGDFLTGVPAYRALARAFPNHRRVLAAPRVLETLARMCGTIDEVVDARPFDILPPSVAGCDVAVNLHGSGPQSHVLLQRTGPRRLLAFANRAAGVGGPVWHDGEHEIVRWCRMLQAFGIPADPTEFEIRKPAYYGDFAGATVLHAGAKSESRRWPVANWIELARRLVRAGHRVVLTGDEAEFRRCRTIAKGAGLPPQSVLAGRTGLEELVALIGAARLLVCGDTGVAHVASALRTPSVLLFGPTAPSRWGPPLRSFHRVIWHGTTGDALAPAVDPGLASIDVDEVVAQTGCSAVADAARMVPLGRRLLTPQAYR